MAAKKKTEIQELSEFIHDHMVTKSDLAEFKAEINETLDDHTRRLTTIENDVKQGLDKRLTLEVRVTNIKKNSSAHHKNPRTSSRQRQSPATGKPLTQQQLPPVLLGSREYVRLSSSLGRKLTVTPKLKKIFANPIAAIDDDVG